MDHEDRWQLLVRDTRFHAIPFSGCRAQVTIGSVRVRNDDLRVVLVLSRSRQCSCSSQLTQYIHDRIQYEHRFAVHEHEHEPEHEQSALLHSRTAFT